jgi:hypothetical protein
MYFPRINVNMCVILVLLGGVYMDNPKITPREAIEVRELISQEVIAIRKISASMDIVSNTELKTYMQDSLVAKKVFLQNIQSSLAETLETI